MPQTHETTSGDNHSPFTWKLGVATLALAAVIGLGVAVQQFLVKFLHDQSAHVRTIWGILFMLLGVLGPLLPLLLLRKRGAFSRLSRRKQWAAVLALPVLYAAALALCMVASTYTKTLLLDRPGLTLLVRFDPANPSRLVRVSMHGLRRELPSGRNWDDSGGFYFQGYQTYLRYPQEVTIAAAGTTQVRGDGRVEATLDVDAKETFRLHVEGLTNLRVTREGGAVLDNVKLAPGKYAMIIKGRSM